MANDKDKTKSDPEPKKKYVKPVLVVKSIENFIGTDVSVFANYGSYQGS